MKWFLLVLLLAVVVFGLGMRAGRLMGRRSGSVAFRPVTDLPADVQASIERDLDAGRIVRAVETYQSVTQASPKAARAAIDVHRRRRAA